MNCDSLKEINLFKFNTENVNSMSYMFYNCESLKILYLSNFNTSYVIYMLSKFPSILILIIQTI